MRAALALLLLWCMPALAQRRGDDAPIPYGDQQDEDEDRRRELPKHSEETRERPSETMVEQQDREISLASDDDPNIGLSGEVLLGAMLLESPHGQGVQPVFLGGLRFTWEWARTLLSDERWREVFFADVIWAASKWNTGTAEVYDNTNFHYFTVAQGFALPLGKTPLAVFALGGIGFNYQTSSIYVGAAAPVDISAARLLVQYGGGLRARIGLLKDDSVRLSFRIELTRFRRGYMDDTLLGGSIGVTF